MAAASFDVKVDAKIGLITITLDGQWTSATVTAFRAALESAYAELASAGYPAGTFSILSDSRVHGVQSQNITASLETLAQDIAAVSRKNAVVVASVLHKLQVDRLAALSNIQSFTDMAAAQAWLRE